MSSAFRYNSKEKKTGKEPAKGSLKLSGNANTSSGVSAGGYNPLLGTFHIFDTAPLPSASVLQSNGRFRGIDDPDDHDGNSFEVGVEYDSVSNNGSWSGESDDHKEKTSQPQSRTNSIPGADNDKREKIRQKNEKKHQRQKERRAQELHERCSGYLMSRKLESLAQQLVAMGFSQERATMALILNEGRVEESVAWLFEGAEEDKPTEQNLDGGGNLKIDISEELARIGNLEIKYKATKQEIERAVVACEGDLDKAEETLKEPPVPPKTAETHPPNVLNTKLTPALSQSSIRVQQVRPTTSSIVIQQKRDDKDFNYTKPPGIVVGSSSDKNVQTMYKIAPKPDWSKPQQIAMPVERRWPSGTSSNPSVSYPLASPPVQAPPAPAKTDPLLVNVTNDQLKNLHLGSLREPVILMQRPQPVNVKQQQAPNPSPRVISSSSPGENMGWYPNIGQTMNPSNAFLPPVNIHVAQGVNSNDSAMYNQFQYQSQQFDNSMDYSNSGHWGGNGGGLWSTTNRGVPSPTLAPASSLGLFSGSSGPGSGVDWSKGGPVFHIDYKSIDWSLDTALLADPRPTPLFHAAAKLAARNNNPIYDPFGGGFGNRSAMGPSLRNHDYSPSIYGSQGGGSIYGMQDSGSIYELQEVSSDQSVSGGGSRDWSSPFEEKDLFSLPRQFV